MKAFEKTIQLLSQLKLKGMSNQLEEEMYNAERHKISYLAFLTSLLETEVKDRRQRRIKRNMTGAHFPNEKYLDGFKYKRVKGITRSDVANLLDFRWLDNHRNLLFFGPPGIGKTHLSIAFGIEAINRGYKVCFEKIISLIKLLKSVEIQRKARFRINRLLKSDLVVIDEIGYTPIERKEANLFFNLISELYEKSSIIITSNKSFDSWAEMMGDDVMTTALLDRLLHHAFVFNMDGDSYRIHNKEDE